MTCFGDTSGFLAVANPADLAHEAASNTWNHLLDLREPIVTTNYVVVETVALLHRRFGISAVRRFREDMLGVTEIIWVDAVTHEAALGAVLAGGRQGPSLVDCVSFEIMRTSGIHSALAFDAHFTALGFLLSDL